MTTTIGGIPVPESDDGNNWSQHLADVATAVSATYLNKENGDTATGAVDFTGGLTDDSRRLLKTAHSGPITMLAGGAIRNDGAPDYWQPIVDVNHQCDVNVESIVTGTVAININFSAEATGKRITCYAVPDETLAALGFHVGASYSAGMMQLKLTRRFLISDYIYYDGSAWQSSQGGRFTIGTFSGGELPLTHQAMPGKSVSITPRGASSVAMLSTGTNALTDTDTKVVFRDWSGALVTTPSTDMKFFVTRHMEYGGTINPQTVDTTAFPLSNIWFAAFSEE